ncbi:(2Fe-2S)-binding protein [Actinopolymorpha sp. B9G3]|uniref:(2Fe-2S)-binding protein n=1 Tax=unclassified Actinopolymorpha TaxID=2627063 RepID=UPI0032D94872
MIICHCEVVTDGAVVESINGGARTLANICKSTGAGRGCGACVFSLKRLLCEHEPSSASPEVEVAAS